MFKTVFAADIGSKCIKCVARGQVAAEETAIALEAGAKLTVAAAGNAALLHRSGVIRPVRDGAAANTRMLALLLGHDGFPQQIYPVIGDVGGAQIP